jgi:PAS domain S-box-containing protein
MQYPLRSPLARYGLALVSVAIAGALSYGIPSLRDQSPTPLFMAAVLVTTWWSGPLPGLAATGLAAFLLDFLFLEPLYAAISNPDDVVRLLVFIAVCALVTLLDAARRRAEESLRRSESRFRRLSDSRLLGVHRASRGGRLIEANDAFLEMLDYTREDVLSGALRLDALTPPEYVDVDARSYIETESRGVCTPYEKEYVRKDGSRVPVLTGSARLEDAPNEDICFTLDISTMKRTERALRESQERLHRARKLESIGRLAGGVANDFGDLLTVIIGRCDLLLRGIDEGSARRSDAETILVEAKRAAKLVRRLGRSDLAAGPDACACEGSERGERDAARGSETLLVVEDEPSLLQLIGEVLRDAGYMVLEAANGAEALALCRRYERHIHLVVTDVAMPKLSGTELAEEVATIRPATRLLAMAGPFDGKRPSPLPFIAKPFTPAAIRRKVRDVLDAKRGGSEE